MNQFIGNAGSFAIGGPGVWIRGNLNLRGFSRSRPILLIALFLLCLRFALAVSLTLVWDANPVEQQVLFYTVYGAKGETAPFAKLAEVTSPTAVVTGVPGSGVYRFRITATNEWGESAPSAEVVFKGNNP